MQRRAVNAFASEVVVVLGVVTRIGVIAGNVRRAGLNGNGRSERDRLPTDGGLAIECGAGEKVAGRIPQVSYVGAGVQAALVEANTGNEAGDVGTEFDPHLNRGPVCVRG